jgi:hypothetical protein
VKQEINAILELQYWALLDVRHSIDNMHIKKNVCEELVEHFYNRRSKEKIIKMQGRVLKIWALGQSSMQRKQSRGRTFLMLQPPSQRQREKDYVSFCMI